MATETTRPVHGFESITYSADEMREQEVEFDRLQRVSDNLPEGDLVGYLWSTPIADGAAIYRVESMKPLRLAHVPYMDAWRAHHTTIRGLRVADLLADQKRNYTIRALFGRK